jgi:hypothetical protein
MAHEYAQTSIAMHRERALLSAEAVGSNGRVSCSEAAWPAGTSPPPGLLVSGACWGRPASDAEPGTSCTSSMRDMTLRTGPCSGSPAGQQADGGRAGNKTGPPDAPQGQEWSAVKCSNSMCDLVELWGFEPQTSCMPCSGNTSTAVHLCRSQSRSVRTSPPGFRPVAVLLCYTARSLILPSANRGNKGRMTAARAAAPAGFAG